MRCIVQFLCCWWLAMTLSSKDCNGTHAIHRTWLATHYFLSVAGHSGLTCSRFDDTLPLLYPHTMNPGVFGHGSAVDQHHWAHASTERGDHNTATSPLRHPLRSTSAGKIFSVCCQPYMHLRSSPLHPQFQIACVWLFTCNEPFGFFNLWHVTHAVQLHSQCLHV